MATPPPPSVDWASLAASYDQGPGGGAFLGLAPVDVVGQGVQHVVPGVVRVEQGVATHHERQAVHSASGLVLVGVGFVVVVHGGEHLIVRLRFRGKRVLKLPVVHCLSHTTNLAEVALGG